MEGIKRNGSAPSPLPPLAPVTEKAFVRISFMSDGSIKVEAPYQNKILCYGLLKSAELAIANMPDSPLLSV